MARAVEPIPDISAEDVTADKLPANQWLELARELAEKGSLRLAIRALYLAILAHLGEKEMITIETYKSNREYLGELKRRAHELKELQVAFSRIIRWFEQVWYGLHRVTKKDLETFSSHQEKIMKLVGS